MKRIFYKEKIIRHIRLKCKSIYYICVIALLIAFLEIREDVHF